MRDVIEITTQSTGPHLHGGPVPVPIVVENLGSAPVSILLPYPNPNDLTFRCTPADLARAKLVEQDPIERIAPLDIPSYRSETRMYYLNRYFEFIRPGRAECSYQLNTSISVEGTPAAYQHETFTGTFTIQLERASDEQVRTELSDYAMMLDNPNRQKRAEAAEALAFLDTPLVIPFLMRMLEIDDLEVIGIHALGRHPSLESYRAITGLLGHPDSAIIAAVLKEVDRNQIPLPRRDAQKLLSSANPNIQWLALGWLIGHPSREDLPLLSQALTSQNTAVRDRARAYEQLLNTR